MANQKHAEEHAFTWGELEQFHRVIETEFTDILGYSVVVPEGEKLDLARLRPDPERPFMFSLQSPGNPYAETVNCSGSQQIVFPLRNAAPGIDVGWVAWSEAWLKVRAGNTCVLKSGGFTFCWGRVGRSENKHVLFRAEWDHISAEDTRSGPQVRNEAAQPHWHVDRKFVLGRGRWWAVGEEDVEPLNLETPGLSPAPLSVREIEPSDIHLAMGGWLNNDRPDLTCWQRQISKAGIQKWAVETLMYMKGQLSRVRPARLLGDEDGIELEDLSEAGRA